MDSITQRTVGGQDEAVLFELFSAVRVEELAMEQWDPAMRDQILRLQFAGQRRGYRGQFPESREILILRNGRAIGWTVIDRSGPALRCVDIAIVPGERNRGVGRRLFEEWQQEAAALNRPVALTVFRGNPRARGFYARLGFVAVGETETHLEMEWRP